MFDVFKVCYSVLHYVNFTINFVNCNQQTTMTMRCWPVLASVCLADHSALPATHHPPTPKPHFFNPPLSNRWISQMK